MAEAGADGLADAGLADAGLADAGLADAGFDLAEAGAGFGEVGADGAGDGVGDNVAGPGITDMAEGGAADRAEAIDPVLEMMLGVAKRDKPGSGVFGMLALSSISLICKETKFI